MAKYRSGGPHRKLRMCAQEGALFGGGRFGAGRAGKDRALVRKPAEFRPQPFQGRGNLAGAFAATRLLNSLLFGVGASDPFTFVAIVLLVSAVAFVAAWLPGTAGDVITRSSPR